MHVSDVAAAAAQALISCHPHAVIAKVYAISTEQLDEFLAKRLEEAGPLTWPQKLAAALADPHSTEPMTLLTSLAQLESQWRQAESIYLRALDLTEQARQRKNCDFKDIFRAEAHVLRSHQHAARLHRELLAAQKEYAAYIAAQKEGSAPKKAIAQPHEPQKNSLPTQTASAQKSTSSPAANSEATTEPQTAQEPISQDEFKQILVQNHQLIEKTSPRDRQALIARLIAQHRQKNDHTQINGCPQPHPRAA
jgi:hypothetical protein